MKEQPSSTSSESLPDINICRAEDIGHSKYAACLVLQSSQCPYALLYVGDHYCYHPNREKIIKKYGPALLKNLG